MSEGDYGIDEGGIMEAMRYRDDSMSKRFVFVDQLEDLVRHHRAIRFRHSWEIYIFRSWSSVALSSQTGHADVYFSAARMHRTQYTCPQGAAQRAVCSLSHIGHKK